MSEPVLSEGEPLPENVVVKGELRPHQTTAVAALKQSLTECGGGMLALACGGGKTVCGLHVASELRTRTLVVVHKTFLLEQWRQRIAEFMPGAKVGVLQGTKRPDSDCDVTVAMLQTLSHRNFTDVNALKPYGLTIIDECHHISARMFSQAMWRIPSKYVMGLSATPDRADGLGEMIHHFVGPLRHVGPRNTNATEVEVQIVKVPGPTLQSDDWITHVSLLSEHPERNAALVTEIVKHGDKQQVLVLSDRVEHLKTLQRLIAEANKNKKTPRALTTGLYVGGMNTLQLKASESSDIILGTYSMASEGLDLPSLSVIVLSTPRREISQCVGRVLRSSKALVVDVVDSHGPSRTRLQYYNLEGFRVVYK